MFIRLGPYLNLNHCLDLIIGENFAKICHHEAEFRRADQSVAVLVKNLTNYLQLLHVSIPGNFHYIDTMHFGVCQVSDD